MTPEQQAAFDSAELYARPDAERFGCTSVREFLNEEVPLDDNGLHHDFDFPNLFPIRVAAYNRKSIDSADELRTVDAVIELMTERYHDDYGDPEDGPEDTTLKLATDGELHNRIKAIVHDYWATGKIWHCEEVARREYSIDEVRAILNGVTK